MKRISFIILLANLLILSLSCTDYSNRPYDLSRPYKTLELNKELKEISGIQKLETGEIAAVQDEKGNIYFLNENTGEISGKYDFGKKGDYEGICLFKDIFYVLESNGSIHEIKEGEKTKIYKFENNDDFDFEGICVNPVNDQLLIACKDHGKKKKNDHIYIYGFSITKKKYLEKEVFKLAKKEIHEKFGASGIAIHPKGEIYLLSSRSKTLLILSEEGNVKENVSLNDFIFRQPEGISFNKEGHLFISNEENNGAPTILVFKEKDEKN